MTFSLLRFERGSRLPKAVEKFDSEEFPEYMRYPPDLKQYLNDIGHLQTFVILDGNRYCGFMCTAPYNRTVFVMFLVIGKEYRGKGLGSFALDMLPQVYPGKSFALDCEESNVPFYERNGFSDTGRRGTYRDEVHWTLFRGKYYPRDVEAIFRRFEDY